MTDGFCSDHLEKFEASIVQCPEPDDIGGKNWKTFADGIEGVSVDQFAEGQIKRSEVRMIVADERVDTLTACAAILAWGGMRIDHRNLAFRAPYREPWLEVADDIRSGKHSRLGAYDAFAHLRSDKQLKGMGPAFFTKLIYFLMPRDDARHLPGFIMDQWAGCSINLLTNGNIVLMDSRGGWKRQGGEARATFSCTVSDVNTGENYVKFCSAIDALVVQFPWNGDQIDRALLSTGGANPAPWREYVAQHRRP